MSYQVLRVQKLKSTAVGACQAHNLRQYRKTAQNINAEQTKLNIELVKCSDFADAINQRVDHIQSQQTRKIRKDCPRALEYVISASPEFFNGTDKREYFEKALEFLRGRHGSENIVSAVIHNDEATPHMHVVVVPVKDKKLNPKHFCDKFELSKLHTQFNQEVGSKFGLSRGESSNIKHQTTAEHRRTLQREVRELENDLIRYRKNEFTVPKITPPKSKLLESKEAYGLRCINSAIEQINPAFKVAQSRYNEAVYIKRDNAELQKKLSEASKTLSETQERVEKYQSITKPLITLYEQIKRNLDISFKEFFDIVIDNSIETFKDVLQKDSTVQKHSPVKSKGFHR